jgi:DNA-directed RNA polymerase specialized sigma24 family protein
LHPQGRRGRSEAALGHGLADTRFCNQRTPTPEETVVMAEEMARLLDRLPDDIRVIAVWKFEGRTNQEIAAKLGYTVRTIERKVKLIRKRWSDENPDLTT